MNENNQLFNLVIKIPDENLVKKTEDEGLIQVPETPRRYFAQKIGVVVREYLYAHKCPQIKYGFYQTRDPLVVKGFEELGKNIRATLEQQLFHAELIAKRQHKRKRVRSLAQIEERKMYLNDNWGKIAPTFKIQRVIE